jgi:hypothetical protein
VSLRAQVFDVRVRPIVRKEEQMHASRLAVMVAVVISLACHVPALIAQEEAPVQTGAAAGRPVSQTPEQFHGFSEYETFQGVVNSLESILKLDSTLGYDFNRHAELFVGLPLYFVPDSGQSSGATRLSGSGAGDFYFGGALYAPGRLMSFGTTLTLAAPTGNVRKGFSTGHKTVDWTNRLHARLGRFTPFIAAGLSNTVPDTDLVTRTFTSLGNVVHLEEGGEYRLASRVYAGASGYHILPFGNQQVIARTGNDRGRHNDAGASPGSIDKTDLTRENGVDTWLGFEPSRILRMEVGYSRSISFALNRLSFNVGVNVGRMVRSMRRHSD